MMSQLMAGKEASVGCELPLGGQLEALSLLHTAEELSLALRMLRAWQLELRSSASALAGFKSCKSLNSL